MPKPDWAVWIPGDDVQVMNLPVELKIKFGTIFSALPPLAEIAQKEGPIVVFESVNRLVRQGHIHLQILDLGRDRYKVRYAMAGFDEMVTIN